jgi:membrane fusion protein, heavy metal efflux system
MTLENSRWPAVAIGGGFVAALALGFFLARITEPDTAPPSSTTAPAEANEVKVEASYLATVGIVTETVTAGDLSTDVLAPGTVTPAPNGEAVVTSHVAGTIVRLAKQLGETVKAGETLALVESREAAGMAADRSVAESKAALARSAATREQELYNQRVTPRQDLERAQAELTMAEAELRRAREAAAASHVTADGKIAVVSPLTGQITAMTAALGTFIQPETELFRIADPQFIQVSVSVTASDAQRIATGDKARVMTRDGGSIAATVRSVTATVSELTRAATVTLVLNGPHDSLSPGEIVQAEITPSSMMQTGVVVPEDAVQNVGGRTVVFVRSATGFKVQPVVIGSRSGGRVSVLSGVNPGETIATTNAFFLKAELNKGAGDDE